MPLRFSKDHKNPRASFSQAHARHASGIVEGMRNVPVSCAFSVLMVLPALLSAQAVKTGQAAFESATDEKPGNRVHITVADLPAPHPEQSVGNGPQLVPRNGAVPVAKPGYTVQLYAEGFKVPRLVRTAPNGDFFMADSGANTVVVLRGTNPDGSVKEKSVFAGSGLNKPFGINFWPATDPKYVYVANTDSVVRFPYKAGDTTASGPAEVVVKSLPAGGGHITRGRAGI
jgi:glucose/arabinose dehydrogenase